MTYLIHNHTTVLWRRVADHPPKFALGRGCVLCSGTDAEVDAEIARLALAVPVPRQPGQRAARAPVPRHAPDILRVSPTVGVLSVPKVGSTAINAALAAKVSVRPRLETLLVPVRDPEERFRSACAQVGLQPGVVLAKLDLTDPKLNIHFRPQIMALRQPREGVEVRLYKFPEHLAALVAALGLESLPPENVSEKKPALTAGQREAVAALYAEDLALYQAISAPGQLLA